MDLNTKEGFGNDNTALIAIGKKGSDFYIIDLVYGNMDIVKQLDEITKFCNKHSYIRQKLIEDKSNGSAVWSLLKRSISGLVPVDPKGINKEVRIMSMIPEINAGNIYIPDKDICYWIKPLLNEATFFPKGKHDDALDALQYGIEYLLVNNVYTNMPFEIATEYNNTTSRKEIRNQLVDNYYSEDVSININYIRNIF
jgi:predicted phage terminase large subunit-like protein